MKPNPAAKKYRAAAQVAYNYADDWRLLERLLKDCVAHQKRRDKALRALQYELIHWVDLRDAQPEESGRYLVCIPPWEGYSDEETIDWAYWNPSHGLREGYFDGPTALEDGCWVSHWAKVRGPNR